MNSCEKGNKYELKSIEKLISENYIILEKNYRNRHGEIDIIAKKDSEIIFVEVKYRKNKNFGYGYEAVDKKKLLKIFNMAQTYIKEKNLISYRLRFDCMSYLGDNLYWIKDMVWGDEIGF